MAANQHKIQRNIWLTLGLMGMCSSALAAVIPAGTELATKQELVRNNGSEPASLDPHKVESDVEFNIISDFFDGLVGIKHDGSIEPRLAESWENKDNRVWTFHLRPDIKWSNGEPITAQDVVFSWRRLVDPKTVSPYGSYLNNMHVTNAGEIVAGKQSPDTLGIKALDDKTVQVTLNQPVAYFLSMLAHNSLVPINQKTVEKYGDKWTQPGNFVSSGAYTLSQWVVNEKVVGERNKNYWDDAHTVINRVTYLPIASETADINRYKAGEIDIAYPVPQIQFKALKAQLGEQVHVEPNLATYYYQFNTTKAPFNDPRVRLALNLGLDKDIIAEKVLGQGQRPAWMTSQDTTGGVTFKKPDYASWTHEQRITEAKKLLKEAGFSEAKPLSFDLLYNTSESHQRIAIAASSMWKKNLGVEAKLQNQEWKTMLDTMHSRTYDLVRYAWIADYDDASTFLNNFRTGDSQNTTGFSNADFDEAMKQAAMAGSLEQRGQFYQKAEDVLAQNVPAIPVYQYVVVKLVKPYVGGYHTNNLGYFYTKDMYIKKH
ncbi:oligopeptide ABC transporter substrate-binding protein OppA [Hafnia paralvei]|uniref:ABC transporter substrate-binding protein n=1 Tax=Hafnia TaxID=568 RepID=UPI000DF360B0|nr:ABC transporter substrate-binding protein [Hafnia paralvei]RDA61392.1 oligopeptide ABC transporter substrate-binding protein OppA [Hafnia paralvei]RDA62218.1 oligopeptide ABC transporter substrate-binding protein OppA [Hafnia paralvei]RDA62352.1 oligopeptide ABC transporter substrate-binding protein OppA [Hafnia paralvei]RDA74127.1 oligopeptide ABC transporter substrate-binding protein OppA [Hafnia paralvei]RDA74713.1 oligopeptide ABC transporter substrate-binding protein OppA [Hafnia paral